MVKRIPSIIITVKSLDTIVNITNKGHTWQLEEDLYICSKTKDTVTGAECKVCGCYADYFFNDKGYWVAAFSNATILTCNEYLLKEVLH